MLWICWLCCGLQVTVIQLQPSSTFLAQKQVKISMSAHSVLAPSSACLSHPARAFAITAHADQRYGDHPYVVHLDAVAALVEPYGEPALTVAYLHDTVEDTAVSLAQVEQAFGASVAACVSVLTDAAGATRAARKAKTYAKMATLTGEAELALLVKVADRLANVRACVQDGHTALWAVYQAEQAVFKAAAYRAGQCDALWLELDGLLADQAMMG